jgi:peptidylprolyl isomerase
MKWERAFALLIATILIGASITACGDSESPDASAKGPSSVGLRATRPPIPPPTGPPPEKLVIRDMQEGTGAEAQKGDKVKIQYYGTDWRGNEHANSWRYSGIPVFTVGERRLLRGLNLALRGMREGGSREVHIPYNLVFYPGVRHITLTPLDGLIYKIYLVDVLGKPSQ